MPPDRVVIYIDGSNLHYGLERTFQRTNVDINSLRNKLCGGHQLVRTYYYASLLDQQRQPDKYRAQQRFLRAMKRLEYMDIRTRRLRYRNWPAEAPIEKGVDIYLTADMLTHCFGDLFDLCVLVSGDTDYAVALQTVKDTGRHVEVALFPPPSSSQPLRDVADRVIDLDKDFLENCWMG